VAGSAGRGKQREREDCIPLFGTLRHFLERYSENPGDGPLTCSMQPEMQMPPAVTMPKMIGIPLILIGLEICAPYAAFPAAPEFSANVTVVVYLNQDVVVGGTDSRLGAFVGIELRGVAAPIEVLGTSMFFLTVYANSDGETVHFAAYLAERDTLLAADERVAVPGKRRIRKSRQSHRVARSPGVGCGHGCRVGGAGG